MAYQHSAPVKITLVAAADLSASFGKFVKLDSNGQAAAVTATTDDVIGVLNNKPAAGSEAEVTVLGVTKMVASAALAVNAKVVTSADGRAAAAAAPAAGNTIANVGRVLTANTAANGWVTVVVNCANTAISA